MPSDTTNRPLSVLRERLWHRSVFMLPMRMRRFRQAFGRWPRLLRPRSFNEKLVIRLSLDRRPLLTEVTGKLEARAFVASRLGRTDAQAALLGVVFSPQELPRLKLPDRFIMKASHASGWLRIVTPQEPTNRDEMANLVTDWLGRDFGKSMREWNYHGLRRAVVFEELLQSQQGIPADVKIFCFDGTVALLQYDSSRFDGHRQTLFDPDWTPLPVRVMDYVAHDVPPSRPICLPEMLRDAAALSRGFDFVRVDFLDLGESYRVGEMTICPQGGYGKFHPPEYDEFLGAKWRLPPLPVLRGWRRPRALATP